MHTIITIGRQYGSGGTEIGRQLAEKLEIPFYDKDDLRQHAVENGLGKVLLESYGQKHASSLLFTLSTGEYSFGYFDASQDRTISQKAYLVAFDTVREVAKQGSCVIAGRCADYVLKDHPHCFNVFIHAPLSARVETVAARMCLSADKACQVIAEQDRLRRNYYNYYTTKEWGAVDSYHLTVDSSMLGVARTAHLLHQMVIAEDTGAFQSRPVGSGERRLG